MPARAGYCPDMATSDNVYSVTLGNSLTLSFPCVYGFVYAAHALPVPYASPVLLGTLETKQGYVVNGFTKHALGIVGQVRPVIS